jgi:hypothetical protein
MSRVDLPSGGWAELRDDLEDVTEGERRPLRVAQWYHPADQLPLVTAENVTRAIITLAVAAWDVKGPKGNPLQIPRLDRNVLDQVRGRDLDALARACSDAKVWDRVFPGFEPDPDPASPFDSSTGSSNGGPASSSTPPSPSPSNDSASAPSSPASGGTSDR